MKVFFRRTSISALTVLLTCWPEEVVCKDVVTDWLKNGEVPAFIAVILGGLLLVTIIGCILCLWCTRRRRAKDFFTNDAREGTSDDNSWEMIPSSKKEAKKNSQEPDSDSVTIIKISVQSTDNKKVEKKSNEETTDLVGEESRDEEHKHQTHPDAACAAGNQIQNEVNESAGMPSPQKAQESVTDTHHENSIDVTNDNKYDESGSADGLQHQNSDKPRAEPLYAEVNKAKKKKVKSGYSIVYAELADFDKNKSDNNSLPRNNPSPVEYAEIARLTKSPRDMCPLDD